MFVKGKCVAYNRTFRQFRPRLLLKHTCPPDVVLGHNAAILMSYLTPKLQVQQRNYSTDH